MDYAVESIRAKAIRALASRPKAAAAQTGLNTSGCGFVEGTRVVTPGGWATVESLHIGDEVLTFDAGFRRIVAISSDVTSSLTPSAPEELRPLVAPEGTLNNRQDLIVQPQQGLLIESTKVRDKWGDPLAVIPGAALEALDGVYRLTTERALRSYLPAFAEDQMVFVNGGTLLFSQCAWAAQAGIAPRFAPAANYNMMPAIAAKDLLRDGAARSIHARPEELRRAA